MHFGYVDAMAIRRLSVFDYDEIQEKLQSNLLAVMKLPKVIRFYHCFGCEKSFATWKILIVLFFQNIQSQRHSHSDLLKAFCIYPQINEM